MEIVNELCVECVLACHELEMNSLIVSTACDRFENKDLFFLN